jgi:hypothetical protein
MLQQTTRTNQDRRIMKSPQDPLQCYRRNPIALQATTAISNPRGKDGRSNPAVERGEERNGG